MRAQLIVKLGLLDEDCFCPTSKDEAIYIEEDDESNRSYIIFDQNYNNQDERAFKCINEEKFEVTHLAIDGCAMSSTYGYIGKKCDFFIFTTEVAAFVELKTNASSHNNVHKHITKAFEQLKTSIGFFDQKRIDYEGRDREAYIVLITPLYPPNPIGQLNRRRAFFNITGFDLLEQNWIKI